MAAIDVALIMPALFLCAQKRWGEEEEGENTSKKNPQVQLLNAVYQEDLLENADVEAIRADVYKEASVHGIIKEVL